MRFETGVLSKTGGREQNQDCCGFVSLDNSECWVLADGLGGHGGGETASKTVVKTVLDEFTGDPQCSPEGLLAVLQQANQALLVRQGEDARLAQMRTTTVVLASDFSVACWGHIGDSRLYHLREGRVRFQTRDHSVPQSLCDAGKISLDDIRFHPDRNRMLRAMGSDSEIKPAIEDSAQVVFPGDAFLMCSDGFWEYVMEVEMEAEYACSPAPQEWLSRMEKRLWKRAPQDHDNYSAIGIFAVSD